MFNFLRNLFTRKSASDKPRLVLPSHGQPPPAKPGPGDSKAAKEQWARQAAQQIDPGAAPEELCGITPEMTKDEISAQLAMLYRRHNRAASSLESNLREEAEIMLDVIASMRQKYL